MSPLLDRLRRARPTVDSPTFRLLVGAITDAEYRSILDAERRGWRYLVARPGWSRRWWKLAEGAVTLLVFLFVLGVILGGCVVMAAKMDALPR